MVCVPAPLLFPAGDLSSQRGAPNGTLATPRSTTWHCLTCPDPVSNQPAPAASQGPVQGLANDNLSPGTSHELVRYTPQSALDEAEPSAPLLLLSPCPETQTQPVSRLPIEILDEIFSYAKPSTLARVALVCRSFEGVATRLLYRHIPSLSLSLTMCCVETLVSKPSLAAHTRTWEIGDTSFLDASRKGLLLPTFFKLLRSALHNMHRLTELAFLLNGPTSHVLLGAPFKLTKLTAFCDFDATFASWLTEQSSLRTAIFCGNFTAGVTLPPDALPSLRRVAAAPLTLSCIMPGRSIREVELCLVHPWSLSPDVLQTTVRIIAFSKGPVDSLKIISHLAEPSETVLSALAVIPSTLNSISNLALHAVSGSISDDILSGLPPILSRFTGLKSLTLFSKNKSDALHAAASTRTLAATWHTTCTSLESVTLAGATYVHNRYHGWVTSGDLAELPTACEQSLQQRAADPCKREASLDDERRAVQGAREPAHGLTPELGVQREGGASIVAIAA